MRYSEPEPFVIRIFMSTLYLTDIFCENKNITFK